MKKNNTDFASQIIELKNIELSLRQRLIKLDRLSDGYDTEMEMLHNRIAIVLNEMIENPIVKK
ncbi:hypothetical protein QNI16_37035 [Cytophagaceae bacterium YF14B1]|uniref:Uncharacterized protein n=1 Tax=Xanthocytophaga flava TaxID=3048013 RepID=A0AAE3QVD1_9BACT|nr:hypothetical protein [Xanthocytophaga flavus]MDJ1486147.1 hypothetical protein [Xanthocytophaga flavus]